MSIFQLWKIQHISKREVTLVRWFEVSRKTVFILHPVGTGNGKGTRITVDINSSARYISSGERTFFVSSNKDWFVSGPVEWNTAIRRGWYHTVCECSFFPDNGEGDCLDINLDKFCWKIADKETGRDFPLRFEHPRRDSNTRPLTPQASALIHWATRANRFENDFTTRVG